MDPNARTAVDVLILIPIYRDESTYDYIVYPNSYVRMSTMYNFSIFASIYEHIRTLIRIVASVFACCCGDLDLHRHFSTR